MKNYLEKANPLFSLLFGTLIFGFYTLYYPYHIHYQEQFQLFLNTSEYLAERTAKPGGLAEYLAGFLIQFFYFSWMGASIIALLLVLIQRLLYRISTNFSRNPSLYLLTFIPSVLYWSLLCNENYLLGGVVGFILVLIPVVLYQRISSLPLRTVYFLIMMPALFWFTGGIVIVFASLCLAWEWIQNGGSLKQRALFALFIVALTILLFISVGLLELHYPVAQLIRGINYHRYTQFQTTPIFAIAFLLLLIPLLFKWLPTTKGDRSSIIVTTFILIAIATGGGYFIKQMIDWDKEEIMAYDYQVRWQNWDKIIEMADKKAPTTSLSVSCLNLALAKKGILGDRMFHYYQNGTAGLLPNFTRDFTIPFVAGEVYYHLGFVNTAQRFAFEAMEAIPDYQKSVRAIKRLAETNIINGNYVVATKYLKLLQQTTMYKSWANQTISDLQDKKRIENKEEWATLRKYRTKEDFLFSEPEKTSMLGFLLQQEPTNRLAYEYLLAYCLLSKDIKHFYCYYPLGNQIHYTTIPVHFQEALIYVWGLSNEDPTLNIPFPISDSVKANVRTYGSIYTSQQNPEPMLRKQFSSTYWYYLHFRKHNKTVYEDLYDVYADNPAVVSPGV